MWRTHFDRGLPYFRTSAAESKYPCLVILFYILYLLCLFYTLFTTLRLPRLFSTFTIYSVAWELTKNTLLFNRIATYSGGAALSLLIKNIEIYSQSFSILFYSVTPHTIARFVPEVGVCTVRPPLLMPKPRTLTRPG